MVTIVDIKLGQTCSLLLRRLGLLVLGKKLTLTPAVTRLISAMSQVDIVIGPLHGHIGERPIHASRIYPLKC